MTIACWDGTKLAADTRTFKEVLLPGPQYTLGNLEDIKTELNTEPHPCWYPANKFRIPEDGYCKITIPKNLTYDTEKVQAIAVSGDYDLVSMIEEHPSDIPLLSLRSPVTSQGGSFLIITATAVIKHVDEKLKPPSPLLMSLVCRYPRHLFLSIGISSLDYFDGKEAFCTAQEVVEAGCLMGGMSGGHLDVWTPGSSKIKRSKLNLAPVETVKKIFDHALMKNNPVQSKRRVVRR